MPKFLVRSLTNVQCSILQNGSQIYSGSASATSSATGDNEEDVINYASYLSATLAQSSAYQTSIENNSSTHSYQITADTTTTTTTTS